MWSDFEREATALVMLVSCFSFSLHMDAGCMIFEHDLLTVFECDKICIHI